MTTEKYFTERQHFRQIWLWAVLIGIDGLFVYGLVKQVYFGQTFGDNPASNEALIALTILTLLISVTFAIVRLDTAIDKDGVHYRYFPFQRTLKNISWDRISKSYVRQYSPIGEYGGWGLRIGLFGKGKAFNVSGNKGLQLVYDNGKKFLLGTQKPDDIKNVLQQLGRQTDSN